MPRLPTDPYHAIAAVADDAIAAVAEAIAERDDDTLPEVIEQLYDVVGQQECREGANHAARRKLADARDAYDNDRLRLAWNRVAYVLNTLN